MRQEEQHIRRIVITNPLGFHVRPIQRFAELAQAFRCTIQVRVEDREACGKSVMGLMSLRATRGSEMQVATSGEDAQQALAVLCGLVENDFFVEEVAHDALTKDRHIRRLVWLVSCFDSDVLVELDGRRADARSFGDVVNLGIRPDSKVSFHCSGRDAEQARKVLETVARRCFYVEE